MHTTTRKTVEKNSYWAPHPSLVDALALGRTFEEWLAGRTPVVSYARVSRDVAGDGRGVGRQHLNNDDAAVRLGWAVVFRFTDNAITASDPCLERAAFRQLLRVVRAGRTEEGYRVRGVIAVEEERLVRLDSDHVLLYRALSLVEKGCLHLVDKGQLIYFSAEMAVGSTSHTAGQREAERMSSRRRRSVRDHAREGRGTGGCRRFGWCGPDTATQRPTNSVLDPYESAYLRGAIDMVLAGTSWTAVTDWLTEEQVPTVRNGRWTVSTVQAMVTNPAICGYRIVDGDLIRGRKSGAPVVGDWQTVATPQEWEKLIERCGRWHSPRGGRPPYKQLYASRAGDQERPTPARERRTQADSRRKYLLSGFLRCGYQGDDGSRCGCKMGGQTPRGTNRHPSYRCDAAKCRKVGRRVDLVDEYVITVAVPAMEEEYRDAVCDASTFPGEERLAILKACEARTPLMDLQIRDLEEDREEFYARQDDRNLLVGFTRERWTSFDIRQRRLALAAVVDEVVILPIPKTRSRNAPFDPGLIDVVLRRRDR
ncbi:recombinase family protein [Streptomyces sp. NPDC051001]|uniref:recombinase family protein n=1 Tax=Streptomyces sp. NPDC051001 TaxID=3155795 RepID=UPI003417D426